MLFSGDAYERQVGTKKHKMDKNTKEERLDILDTVVEDWHCELLFHHNMYVLPRIQLREIDIDSNCKHSL